jgi:hypothetical protein
MFKGFYHERVVPAWLAFACAFGDFLDEAAYRCVLAFDVITGRVPREVEQRWWNRSLEAPVLIEVRDWVTDRRLFSILVWPSLESAPEDAQQAHFQRVQQVKEVIAKGASDMAMTTSFETDYGLRWDYKREVWTASDFFAYDGKRTDDAA